MNRDVMADVRLNTILSNLTDALDRQCRAGARIGIFPHPRVDGDAIGSSLALGDVLRRLGADVTVWLGEPIPSVLTFLPTGGMVRILTREAADAQSTLLEPPDFAIMADCHTGDRLEHRIDFFRQARQHAMIDHHVRACENGPLEFVSERASSTAELVFLLIRQLETMRNRTLFTKDVCTWLLAGLLTDTGRFGYSCTTPASLRQAAYMVEHFPVDLERLTHELFTRTTVPKLRIQGAVMANMKMGAGCRILTAAVSREMLTFYGATDEDLEYLSSDMREADGVAVAMLIRESAERDEIRVSVRSNSCFDAASFAAEYGGGGHVKAAGFTLKDMTLTAAETMLLRDAEARLNACSPAPPPTEDTCGC